jgi:hypothetical protein
MATASVDRCAATRELAATKAGLPRGCSVLVRCCSAGQNSRAKAQGASYAAVVSGARGCVFAATRSSAGAVGDRLSIDAQSISDVTTSAYDDVVTLCCAAVSGIYTGGGSDAISILGGVVSGIHTDTQGPDEASVRPPPPPLPPEESAASEATTALPLIEEAVQAQDDAAEPRADPAITPSALSALVEPVVADNDALYIAAYLISDISAGAGNDALALKARSVQGVDAGSGDDAIAIKAQVVTGVTGGDGNDAIAVSAGVGVAGASNAAAWFAMRRVRLQPAQAGPALWLMRRPGPMPILMRGRAMM